MSNFSAMKKRSAGNSFAELQKELESQDKGGQSFDDERFWYPERDKEGKAAAVIRFLPAADGDSLPMQKFFSHSKKFTGGWYIEECPTTIGKDCPLCAENDVLWNSGKDGQAQVRDSRKRKMRYVCNIMVVRDPANPDNEGKRFLFQFGFKIHTMIMTAMKGVEDELEPENSMAPCNIFDFWEGKNFSLKIAKVDGQTNYDKSSFSKKPTPLHSVVDGKPVVKPDEELEALWNSQYKLAEYADGLKYKDPKDLKARLDKVQGRTKAPVEDSAEGMADAGESSDASLMSDAGASDAGTTAEGGESEDDFFDNL